MYVYEKQAGRIKVSKLVPNMEEIRKLKEQEVYGKLDYLTMMRAETNVNASPLLDDDIKSKYEIVSAFMPVYYPGYHRLEKDIYISEDEAFANLMKVVNFPVFKNVKYLDGEGIHFLALTNPKYETVAIRDAKEIKAMSGIVPVSERLYNANHLVELLYQSDLEKLYTSMPEGYFAENSQLLEVKGIFTPNLWLSNLEDLYTYGIITNDTENFKRKLEYSNEIISRVRRK